MLIDATVTGNGKGVLSRCKVCGRYFTWESKNEDRYFNVIKKRWVIPQEPEHCSSSVCLDFWRYYEEHKAKMSWNLEYAKHAYLQRRGML